MYLIYDKIYVYAYRYVGNIIIIMHDTFGLVVYILRPKWLF